MSTSLKVTPQISEGNTIKLKIKQETSRIDEAAWPDDAVESAMEEDPDDTLALLADLTGATDPKLRELARRPNVFCKLSGMVTEAKWKQWRPEDFHRYIDIVIEAFGTDRVMTGSDWPVSTLSGDYVSTMNIVIDYAQQFPSGDRDAILGGNCARFYGINQTTKKP